MGREPMSVCGPSGHAPVGTAVGRVGARAAREALVEWRLGHMEENVIPLASALVHCAECEER